MAFFRNTTVNLLNLHYGLFALAMGGGGVFFGVYLLKAGVAAPMVLFTLASIHVVRFTIRPLVLAAAKRVGLRPVVIFGTVMLGLQYPFLPFVHGLNLPLLGICVIAAIGDAAYWTSYHAYFAQVGDEEHRGHQIGAREALASVVGVVAPLMGGWALATLGAKAAFGAVAAVQILAALPLLGGPAVAVAKEAPGAFKSSLGAFLLYAADGWIAAGLNFVWQIVLFVSLSESFAAYGGAMALAAVAGAVAGLLLGRHIDAGHGGRAVWLSFAVLTATILLRTVAATPAMALIANALGALVGSLYVPTMMTAAYNQAMRSPCPMRFQMAAEGGWDVGCGAGCLTAGTLVALGVPLRIGVLISLAGVVAVTILLRRYYAVLSAPAAQPT